MKGVSKDRRARPSSAVRLKPDRPPERCSRGLRRAPLPSAYACRQRHRLDEICVSAAIISVSLTAPMTIFRDMTQIFRCLDRRAVSLHGPQRPDWLADDAVSCELSAMRTA